MLRIEKTLNGVLLAASVCLSAVPSNADSENKVIGWAEKKVCDTLVDCSGVFWRNVYVMKALPDWSVATVCGQVNAKDQYGQYQGYHRFMYVRTHEGEALVVDDGNTGTAELDDAWPNNCLPIEP